MDGRIQQYLDFIVEIDKVKNIFRKSKLFDGGRFENDAEHSWTVAIMAALFQEFSGEPVQLEKVLVMLLIHDIVEIDAGDTYLYAPERADAAVRERAAAQRIFGMLDDGHKDYFIGLWEEFESRETPEAKYAAVFDRLEPIYQNYLTGGATWRQNGVRKEQVLGMSRHIADYSPKIWEFIEYLLDDAVRKGFLAG